MVGGVLMVEVDSGDVLAMRDEKVSDLIAELNQKQAEIPIAKILVWLFLPLFFLFLFISKATALAFLCCALIGWLGGRWFDSYNRRTVLLYDLDDRAKASYEGVMAAFEVMKSCRGAWHISAGGIVADLTTWKRNAGASRLVQKKSTVLAHGLPQVIAANLDPPSIGVGTQTIYFMPDTLLVFDGKRFGAVGYEDLQLRWEPSRFIEEGKVPSDTTIVDYTWAHPNKNGGPDRRFARNHQIPICLYEVLHLTSQSGLNELLEFSRPGVSAPLAGAIQQLRQAVASNDVGRAALLR